MQQKYLRQPETCYDQWNVSAFDYSSWLCKIFSERKAKQNRQPHFLSSERLSRKQKVAFSIPGWGKFGVTYALQLFFLVGL